MGLDNGIILKTKKKLNISEDIPSYAKIEESYMDSECTGGFEYDVCYWRKCWNIRSKMKEIIDMPEMDYRRELTIPNLMAISNMLYSCLCHPEDWIFEDCFWTFDEMMPHIAQDIVNISWLIEYLKDDTHSYCYFYDSF